MALKWGLLVALLCNASVEAQNGDNIRLTDGCDGVLQVQIESQGELIWATACDYRFGPREAEVACRQLGCPTDNIQNKNVTITTSPRVFKVFSHTCNGSEMTFDDCSARGGLCAGTGIEVTCGTSQISSGLHTLATIFILLISFLVTIT